MEKPFDWLSLPYEQFVQLGLYENNKFKISEQDVQALVEGRRTGMVTLNNISADGIQIDRLDCKIALHQNDDGSIGLKINPIYKEPLYHPLLTDSDVEQLTTSKSLCIVKADPDSNKKINLEFDPELNSFVFYEQDSMIVPVKINNEELTKSQIEALRNGEKIKLSDDTEVQHKATERNGFLSNRKALILLLSKDESTSYHLIAQLNNLPGSTQKQLDVNTLGFKEAFDLRLKDLYNKMNATFSDLDTRFEEFQKNERRKSL